MERIKVIKMPLGQTTNDGAYYAKVDGQNIGVNGRTHWHSEASARLAAKVFLYPAQSPTELTTHKE